MGEYQKKSTVLKVPVPVGEKEIVIQASTRKNHVLFVTRSGHLYGMGTNASGECGTVSSGHLEKPTRVMGELKKEFVVQASAGDQHSGCVTKSGKAFTWGCGSDGRLGNGQTSTKKEPVHVGKLYGLAQVIACGDKGTMIQFENALFAAGSNSNYALALASTGCNSSLLKVNFACEFVQICLGNMMGLGLTVSGELYSWGRSYVTGNRRDQRTPQRLDVGEPVTQIACGHENCFALTRTGALYTWGRSTGSYKCTIPHGRTIDFSLQEPTVALASDMDDDSIVYVAASNTHVVVVTENGELHSCGTACNATGFPSARATLGRIQQNFGVVGAIAVGYQSTYIVSNMGYSRSVSRSTMLWKTAEDTVIRPPYPLCTYAVGGGVKPAEEGLALFGIRKIANESRSQVIVLSGSAEETKGLADCRFYAFVNPTNHTTKYIIQSRISPPEAKSPFTNIPHFRIVPEAESSDADWEPASLPVNSFFARPSKSSAAPFKVDLQSHFLGRGEFYAYNSSLSGMYSRSVPELSGGPPLALSVENTGGLSPAVEFRSADQAASAALDLKLSGSSFPAGSLSPGCEQGATFGITFKSPVPFAAQALSLEGIFSVELTDSGVFVLKICGKKHSQFRLQEAKLNVKNLSICVVCKYSGTKPGSTTLYVCGSPTVTTDLGKDLESKIHALNAKRFVFASKVTCQGDSPRPCVGESACYWPYAISPDMVGYLAFYGAHFAAMDAAFIEQSSTFRYRDLTNQPLDTSVKARSGSRLVEAAPLELRAIEASMKADSKRKKKKKPPVPILGKALVPEGPILINRGMDAGPRGDIPTPKSEPIEDYTIVTDMLLPRSRAEYSVFKPNRKPKVPTGAFMVRSAMCAQASRGLSHAPQAIQSWIKVPKRSGGGIIMGNSPIGFPETQIIFDSGLRSEDITVSGDGTTALNASSAISSVACCITIEKGVREWEVSFQADEAFVGVADAQTFAFDDASAIGSGEWSGWAISTEGVHDEKFNPIKTLQSRLPSTSERAFGVRVNSDNKTVEFFDGGLNGPKIYKCSNVKGPLRPVVSFAKGRASIRGSIFDGNTGMSAAEEKKRREAETKSDSKADIKTNSTVKHKPFQLGSAKKGSKVVLTNHNKTISGTGIGTVVANEGYDTGVHTWVIRWDAHGNGDPRIGIVKHGAKTEKRLGEDGCGWGLDMDKNGGFYLVRPMDSSEPKKGYTTTNRQARCKARVGGTVKVILDCEAGTLTYQSDGKVVGTEHVGSGPSFTGLPRIKLYPAFSINSKKETFTIISQTHGDSVGKAKPAPPPFKLVSNDRIELSNGGLTAKAKVSPAVVFGNTFYSEGKHEWTIKWDKHNNGDPRIGVSLLGTNPKQNLGSDKKSWALDIDKNGGYYLVENGKSTSRNSAHKARVGGTLRTVLDCDAGTVSYYVDGRLVGTPGSPGGPTFTGLKGQRLCPSFSFNNSHVQWTLVSQKHNSFSEDVKPAPRFDLSNPSDWQIDKSKMEVKAGFDKSINIKKKSGSRYTACYKKPMTEGVYAFTYTMTNTGTRSPNNYYGVVPAISSVNRFLGSFGYGMSSSGSKWTTNSSSSCPIGATNSKNNMVTMIVDMDNNTLTMKSNGKSSVTHTRLPNKVYLGVSLNYTGTQIDIKCIPQEGKATESVVGTGTGKMSKMNWSVPPKMEVKGGGKFWKVRRKDSGGRCTAVMSMPMTFGVYKYEVCFASRTSGSTNNYYGISDKPTFNPSQYIGQYGWALNSGGSKWCKGSNTSSGLGSHNTPPVKYEMRIDMTTRSLYMSKDGNTTCLYTNLPKPAYLAMSVEYPGCEVTVRSLNQDGPKAPLLHWSKACVMGWDLKRGSRLLSNRYVSPTVGNTDLGLINGAKVKDNAVYLDGKSWVRAYDGCKPALYAKSLEIVCKLETLKQHKGAGLISFDDGYNDNSGNSKTPESFDGLAFSETSPDTVFLASDGNKRTPEEPEGLVPERKVQTWVHFIVSYHENGYVQIFRNGKAHGRMFKADSSTLMYAEKTRVLVGKTTHSAKTGFQGWVRCARVYKQPITPEAAKEMYEKEMLDGDLTKHLISGKEFASWGVCADGHAAMIIKSAKMQTPLAYRFNAKVDTGSWTHLTFNKENRGQALALYVNGRVADRWTPKGGIPDISFKSYYIGADSRAIACAEGLFPGDILGVRIFKSSLDANDVSPSAAVPNSLIADIKVDSATGKLVDSILKLAPSIRQVIADPESNGLIRVRPDGRLVCLGVISDDPVPLGRWFRLKVSCSAAVGVISVMADKKSILNVDGLPFGLKNKIRLGTEFEVFSSTAPKGCATRFVYTSLGHAPSKSLAENFGNPRSPIDLSKNTVLLEYLAKSLVNTGIEPECLLLALRVTGGSLSGAQQYIANNMDKIKINSCKMRLKALEKTLIEAGGDSKVVNKELSVAWAAEEKNANLISARRAIKSALPVILENWNPRAEGTVPEKMQELVDATIERLVNFGSEEVNAENCEDSYDSMYTVATRTPARERSSNYLEAPGYRFKNMVLDWKSCEIEKFIAHSEWTLFKRDPPRMQAVGTIRFGEKSVLTPEGKKGLWKVSKNADSIEVVIGSKKSSFALRNGRQELREIDAKSKLVARYPKHLLGEDDEVKKDMADFDSKRSRFLSTASESERCLALLHLRSALIELTLNSNPLDVSTLLALARVVEADASADSNLKRLRQKLTTELRSEMRKLPANAPLPKKIDEHKFPAMSMVLKETLYQLMVLSQSPPQLKPSEEALITGEAASVGMTMWLLDITGEVFREAIAAGEGLLLRWRSVMFPPAIINMMFKALLMLPRDPLVSMIRLLGSLVNPGAASGLPSLEFDISQMVVTKAVMAKLRDKEQGTQASPLFVSLVTFNMSLERAMRRRLAEEGQPQEEEEEEEEEDDDEVKDTRPIWNFAMHSKLQATWTGSAWKLRKISSGRCSCSTTVPLSKGIWKFEVKLTNKPSNCNNYYGVLDVPQPRDQYVGQIGWALTCSGSKFRKGSSSSFNGGSLREIGKICTITIDADRGILYAKTPQMDGELYNDLPRPCYPAFSLEYQGTEIEIRPLSWRGGDQISGMPSTPLSWFYDLLTADDSTHSLAMAGTGYSRLPADFVREVFKAASPGYCRDSDSPIIVSKFYGRAGALLDQLTFVQEDGSKIVAGGGGGSEKPGITLNPGEYVVEIASKEHNSYIGKGVVVKTNKNRTVTIAGSSYYSSGNVRTFKAKKGYQIIGVVSTQPGKITKVIEAKVADSKGANICEYNNALGRPTRQSSTLAPDVHGVGVFAGPKPKLSLFGSENAVDGVTLEWRCGMSKTEKEKAPWWEVDMGEPVRLGRASVLLGPKPPSTLYLVGMDTKGPQDAVRSGIKGRLSGKEIKWSGSITDKPKRYWRIQYLPGTFSSSLRLEIKQFYFFKFLDAKEADKKVDKNRIPAPSTAYEKILSLFNPAALGFVVDLINRWMDRGGVAKLGQELASQFAKDKNALASNQHLSKISPSNDELEMVAQILIHFNKIVKELLPVTDLTLPKGFSELSDNLREARRYIFWKEKSSQWRSALSRSQKTKLNPQITFSMLAARQLYLDRKTDHKGRRSLFGQFYRATKSMDQERLYKISKDERAFSVRDIHMSVADAGGPYRDYVSKMMKEVQDPVLPLFIKCPNGRNGVGENRNCVVPRSSSTSAVCLDMYETLGKFMGMVMRSKNLVSLDFPGLVWKRLIRDTITEYDVRAIDLHAFNKIDAIRKVEASRPSPKLFDSQMKEVKFVTRNSEGKTVELIPNGKKSVLTWDNRREYVRLLRRMSFHEFDTQIDAMKKGLAFVVPISLLTMFTWQEVSALVCGRGMSLGDIELLEQMTSYSGGHNKNTTTIKLFWKMMKERFSEEDRAAFLAFVWGRNRLPTDKASFTQRFTISGHSRSNSNPNNWFPIAHTCGFSVEMPKYTTLEAMEKKIKWAMYNCTTTDADGSIQRSGMVVGLSGGPEDEKEPSLW
uniref:Uncharacterized protein n=1 Tax=Amorphochlora amoebiformis TaxID=1561963 RepID=A0A7S0DIF5_9EUKA